MITISSPRLSFVQFNNMPDDMPLPIVLATDLAFQVLLTASDEAEADELMTKPKELWIWSNAGAEVHSYLTDPLTFLQYRVSATQVLLYWANGLPNLATYVNINTCFRLALYVNWDEDTSYRASSNSFKFIDASTFTSVLEYSCEENSYGFTYCAAYTPNRVRLPLYLLRPQFQDTENIYVKSDGSFKVTSSVTKKEYEAKVDYYDELMHEKIKVVLSHDIVSITSDVYSGGLRKNGNYEILWDEIPGYSETASAKFKAYASPYLVRNDNCAVCEDYVPVICEAVGVEETPVLPDGVLDEAYSYSFPLIGDGPFELIINNKPSWMSIAIVDGSVVLGGTPDTEATDIEVDISVSNCDGEEVYHFTDTIDITEFPPECIPVFQEMVQELWDADLDADYDKLFTVEGTAPFEIENEIKPDWMEITVVDNVVHMNGTPTAGDEAICLKVAFDITNCESGTLHIEDYIVVGPPLEFICYDHTAENTGLENDLIIAYKDCSGDDQTATIAVGDTLNFCAFYCSPVITEGTGTIERLETECSEEPPVHSFLVKISDEEIDVCGGVETTVYSLDAVLADGSIIYSDIAMTIVVPSGDFLSDQSELDIVYDFPVYSIGGLGVITALNYSC